MFLLIASLCRWANGMRAVISFPYEIVLLLRRCHINITIYICTEDGNILVSLLIAWGRHICYTVLSYHLHYACTKDVKSLVYLLIAWGRHPLQFCRSTLWMHRRWQHFSYPAHSMRAPPSYYSSAVVRSFPLCMHRRWQHFSYPDNSMRATLIQLYSSGSTNLISICNNSCHVIWYYVNTSSSEEHIVVVLNVSFC